MSTWTNNPYHDAWEAYMGMERMQLAERASGKMRRAIGREGESGEELERIAKEDKRKARAGLVKLNRGTSVYYKHIDDITPEDRLARIEAERVTARWLRGRIEAERIVATWREQGWHQPED